MKNINLVRLGSGIGKGVDPLTVLDRIFIYFLLLFVPLVIYPIATNGKSLDMRTIREVAFFSSALIILSYLQQSKWLKYFLIWCVMNFWLNFFLPPYSSRGISNIMSAILIYVGFKYLLRKGIVKADTILRLFCCIALFSIGWALMQRFLHYDPIFFAIDQLGNKTNFEPMPVAWSGHFTTFGTLIVMLSFLFLHYFKIKKIPILFFLCVFVIPFSNCATAPLSLGIGGIFYILNKDYKKWVKIIVPVALIVGVLLYWKLFHHPSVDDRFWAWSQIIHKGWETRPIVGNGINSLMWFGIVDSTHQWWAEAHNDFVQIFLELGFIGLTLFVGFIVSRFVVFFKDKRNNKQICIMSGLVVFLVSSLTLFSFHLAQLGFIALVMLACLEVSYDTPVHLSKS
jgi:hypothetical protein